MFSPTYQACQVYSQIRTLYPWCTFDHQLLPIWSWMARKLTLAQNITPFSFSSLFICGCLSFFFRPFLRGGGGGEARRPPASTPARYSTRYRFIRPEGFSFFVHVWLSIFSIPFFSFFSSLLSLPPFLPFLFLSFFFFKFLGAAKGWGGMGQLCPLLNPRMVLNESSMRLLCREFKLLHRSLYHVYYFFFFEYLHL